MKHGGTRASVFIVLLVLGVIGMGQDNVQTSATPTTGSSSHPPAGGDKAGQDESVKKAARDQQAKVIDQRERETTGIMVGQPKIYDDWLLQQMLNAAQAKLASLQLLDQSGIASHLGVVTGATQSITSVGITAQGPALPQVLTTNNGGTNSTVTGNTTGTTSTGNTSTASSQTTANAPVTNVATTNPQTAAPTAAIPASSTSLPSSFGVSASDLLEEQMQLTYEIANLRLLLSGSLNDWTIGTTKSVKPRVTLGFPITISPDKHAKDATAVVEVEIEKDPQTEPKSEEGPSLITLLPREKTYNVAKITDNNLAINAGIATQVMSVAGSFARGTKTYYLVKDVDTLALTFQPATAGRIGFLWQFRPVLGQRYVKAGLKQTFVQVAFPSNWTTEKFGRVYVRTYWKYFDRKEGYAKKIKTDSLRDDTAGWPITRYSLEQTPKTFNSKSLQDLGNGQMLVTLGGRYLDGTYVRIGANILQSGSPAFTMDNQQIRFVAPILDLATKQTALVARDGTEHLLSFGTEPFTTALVKPDLTFTPVDDANTQITASFSSIPDKEQQEFPLIAIVGGKVYGYADAPVQRSKNSLTVVVPTSTLLANPAIVIKSLFAPEEFYQAAQFAAIPYPQGSQPPKLVLLEQSDASVKYLLYGAGLDSVVVLAPATAIISSLPGDTGGSLRTITLSKDAVKADKQLVFKTKDGLRFAIPFPAAADTPDVNKYNLKVLKPVTVGDDEVIFQGDGLTGLQKVLFNGAELKLRKQTDGKMVWVSGLRAAGATSEAKTQSLDFIFKAGKTSVSVTVAPKS